MKKEDFIYKLKELMEVEDDNNLNENTDLRSLEEYDSLAVMGMIALIDEDFGKKIPGSDFMKVTSIKSLIELIGEDNFE